ncbi:hypothetical protein [Halopseudomonas aestusnigri]|nr:hypothetical protein [Halopseudomonas aestusnigri]
MLSSLVGLFSLSPEACDGKKMASIFLCSALGRFIDASGRLALAR